MGTVVEFPRREEVIALTDLLLKMSKDSELALIHKDSNGLITVQHWSEHPTTASRMRLFAQAVLAEATENERHNGH
jgi:hypothetical protein